MQCVYITVFNQEKYIDMLYLLLESIYLFGELDDNTDILIYTSTSFKNLIQASAFYSPKLKFEVNDTKNSVDKGCKARLDLFQLPSIKNYEKILYLDTDILIKGPLLPVFALAKKNILYVLEEYTLTYNDYVYGGKTLFGEDVYSYEDQSAFSSGIMLFNNCSEMIFLFKKINEKIVEFANKFPPFDQPYIVYCAFKHNLYDNKKMKDWAVNLNHYFTKMDETVYEKYESSHLNKSIVHFPGFVGVATNKLFLMENFLKDMKMIENRPRNSAEKRNCVFITIFYEENYLNMLYLLLESIYLFGELDDKTDVLIYTSTKFKNIIKMGPYNSSLLQFAVNDSKLNVDSACKARLDLFSLPQTNNYEKILYLDTDILIQYPLSKVFDIAENDLLYVLREGYITDNINGIDIYGGKTFFKDSVNKYADKSAFSSGILLLKNCIKMRKLFYEINKHIRLTPHDFHDQPHIVYNAFKYNLFDNKLLTELAVNINNCEPVENIFMTEHNKHYGKAIIHFPGVPGRYAHKIFIMGDFLKDMKIQPPVHNFKGVYDVKVMPPINTTFPLVALCVSYNYLDSFKFTLPVNYRHFQKIYVITQADDLQTINFCKQFDNVSILFFTFKTEQQNFDKFGAINFGLQTIYKENPNNWYLIIDSDILLPNNFVEILTNENLNPECIYGATRNDVLKSSLLKTKSNVVAFYQNNKFHDINYQVASPSPDILGCFQLFKKTNSYYRHNLIHSLGWGDFYFGHDNFNLFCDLKNLLIFHCGQHSKNWNGKVISFIDDIDISLTDIYFNCAVEFKNIYFNKNKKIVSNEKPNLVQKTVTPPTTKTENAVSKAKLVQKKPVMFVFQNTFSKKLDFPQPQNVVPSQPLSNVTPITKTPILLNSKRVGTGLLRLQS